ncbi:ribosome assembly protein SQT1 [Angomonas deanei]|uniref:WD domain, G-beta repeat, putative n=1 Tax=Angomonas deanei TaxID=59799 RepID=A0A7G2CDG1_9TRYP|nr:ribosome assembly protein SQT1 [Angomonas deanei]CAD2217866.1 WD domain, G-beta repeat, putative [Angomonas deanei]|eukprot:EPY29813.1 ribosome assembly protein SQT1 [Angomonas deanei]
MSSNNHDDDYLEGEDEAFIDLDDPNVEVVDDGEDRIETSSTEGDANEEAHEQSGADEEMDASTPQNNTEIEDLNAIPDIEPERDDAQVTFAASNALPIHAVDVHPTDPTILAAAGEGEVIYILRRSSDQLAVTTELTGHTDTISLLQFSPNGKYLASGSLDCSVCLWDTATWERRHQFTDLYGEIMTMLWHPSSLLLLAGADDAQIGMWNTEKGTLTMYFVGHRDAITCLTWTPDVKKLVSGSSDGSVTIFSPKTGTAEITVGKDLSPDAAGVTILCFVGPDQCVVGCEDGTIHVVSLQNGKVVTHFENIHEQAIESMKPNDTHTFLLTCGCDCKLVIWNISDFTVRSVIEVGESIIPARWIQSYKIVGGCSDGTVRVWDGRSSQTEPLQVFMGHRRMILDLAVTEDCVVTASDDGSVRVFQLE